MDSWDYLCMLWLFSHPGGMTLFPKPPRFNYLGYGSSVLPSVCICIQMKILNMHTSRGSVFHYLRWRLPVLLQILVLSSNTKKGEIERTFLNPYVLSVR